MGKFIDLTGKRFGRLTVIKYLCQSKWLCKCDCGNEKIVKSGNLKNGHVKSCGCLNKEISRNKMITHGYSSTRIYKIYIGIKKRCYNKNYSQFYLYGGRGITICDEWKDSFIYFYNWAINNGYKDSLTIDRIDNNGNYEPKNCRWITQKQQNRNTRHNRLITYNNETHCISEWAEIKNLTYSSLQHRLNRNWTIEKALNTPMFHHYNRQRLHTQ